MIKYTKYYQLTSSSLLNRKPYLLFSTYTEPAPASLKNSVQVQLYSARPQ